MLNDVADIHDGKTTVTVDPVHVINAELATDLYTKLTGLSQKPTCRQLGNYIYHSHLLLLSRNATSNGG